MTVSVSGSLPALKLYGADSLNFGSFAHKRKPSGFIDSLLNKRQKIDGYAYEPSKNLASARQNCVASKSVNSTDWTPAIDLQLSPKKALRAAMLKSRYAETILKAKQKTLLDNVDPLKLPQPERQQQEEKARIEDLIRAAKAASSLRAQEELRIRREREREAARIALQKMEKSVEIEDNMKVLKELEIIISGSKSGWSLWKYY